jgi:hypothetical protein
VKNRGSFGLEQIKLMVSDCCVWSERREIGRNLNILLVSGELELDFGIQPLKVS